MTDLHRHFIDHLTIPSRQGKGQLRRIEDVFDCWFESGENQGMRFRHVCLSRTCVSKDLRCNLGCTMDLRYGWLACWRPTACSAPELSWRCLSSARCSAGSMPYAQQHYPFENKEQFEGGFPADFVAEGLDQVRGCLLWH